MNRYARHLVAALASVSTLIHSHSVAGDCSGEWLRGSEIPGLAGPTIASSGFANALTLWDPDGSGPQRPLVVCAGGFSKAGSLIEAKDIVAFDPYSNSWTQLGDGLSNPPSSLAIFNGELYACGDFNSSGSTSISRIAKWTGSAWVGLGSGLNGNGNSMIVFDNSLIVAGSFTTAGGSSASRVARWDGSAWHNLGAGLSGTVNSLNVYGGKLIAAGSFAMAGATTVSNIAAWDGTNWIALGTGVPSNASTTAIYAGSLFCAGDSFAYLWNGTTWTSLRGPGTVPIRAAASFNGELYVGGQFQEIEGIATRFLAKWNGTNWSAVSGANSTSAPGSSAIYALLTVGDELIVGGSFSEWDARPAQGLTIWNGNTWRSVGGGIAIIPWSLSTFQGTLISASAWSSYEAIWQCSDTKTWTRFGNPLYDYAPGYQISYALEYAGQLHILGSVFRVVRLVPGIGKWGGSEWQSVASVSPTADCMIEYDGKLIVGGTFNSIAATNIGSVASWDGTSWAALATTDETNAIIQCFEIFNGDLIAAGNFSSIGGVTAANIARWDGTTWHPLGSGTSGPVWDLTIHNGKLIVAGSFSSPAWRIASWDGTNWASIGSGLIDGSVFATETYNGDLYAAGDFLDTVVPTVGGCKYFARWNGTSWAPLGVTSNFSNPTRMIVYNNELIVSGNDIRIAGKVNAGVARWYVCPPCPADMTGDGLVDDADFIIFISQYDILDCEFHSMLSHCPGDLDRDAIVNDADFVLFLVAYDNLVCD